MHIILCHENADFDAVAALLAAHKLNPARSRCCPTASTPTSPAFWRSIAPALPFVAREDYQPDHARPDHPGRYASALPQIKGIKPGTPVQIIDHHPLLRATSTPTKRFSGDAARRGDDAAGRADSADTDANRPQFARSDAAGARHLRGHRIAGLRARRPRATCARRHGSSNRARCSTTCAAFWSRRSTMSSRRYSKS